MKTRSRSPGPQTELLPTKRRNKLFLFPCTWTSGKEGHHGGKVAAIPLYGLMKTRERFGWVNCLINKEAL